jgi:hypothetical protein
MKFQPGNRAGGRPAGARNRLSKRLLEDLLVDWEEHGPAAIEIMRREDPSAYVRVMVSTLPKEFTVETALADLSDDDIDNLIGQIKNHMLEARREAPKLIEGETIKVTNGFSASAGGQTAGRIGAAGGDKEPARRPE